MNLNGSLDVNQLNYDSVSVKVQNQAEKPSIELTSIPPYGRFEDLKGRALGLNPNDYKVAVYI
ncbi:hypothetical protein THIOM_002242 [Candidatus Thiomargarita nelsonii]|uniref:Uncharacterized protein n=1 Tax=Candidatus Thiomargarita nelsonii TaxID=1003181 RepID=A0A176S1T4_9GAMM|nr:hypothetical protein THIOM_002242 [Candidatus Thiomargarita nelsonii]